MKKNRHTEEQIIGILREAEASGADILKKLVAEQFLAIDVLKEFSRKIVTPVGRRRLLRLAKDRGIKCPGRMPAVWLLGARDKL